MRVVETVVFWMRWSVTAAVVAVLLLAGDRSVAQDEIRRAATQSPPVEPIAGPAAAKDEKFEQWIYVPYRDLKSVFEKHPSAVFLPYMEYLRLWERAGAADRVAKGPPVSGVITQADYVATVDENLARITATLSVQVLGKSWSEIPIRFGQAAIGKVTAIRNGKATQVLLRGTGAGQYALLFPEPGTHAVTLELTARIRASADGHSFDFDCPTVGMLSLIHI